MTKPKKLTPETAKKIALQAYEEWMAKNRDEQAIRERVFEMLDQATVKIVTTLLGFRTDWGRWELERGANHPATKFLEKACKQSVELWLAEQAGDLPKLPAAAKKALHEAYLDSYTSTLRQQMRQFGEEAAEKDAKKILEELGWGSDSSDDVPGEEETSP